MQKICMYMQLKCLFDNFNKKTSEFNCWLKILIRLIALMD